MDQQSINMFIMQGSQICGWDLYLLRSPGNKLSKAVELPPVAPKPPQKPSLCALLDLKVPTRPAYTPPG